MWRMLGWPGRILYWLGWALVRSGLALLLRFRIEGRHKVPRRGTVLIASNHLSNLDPLLIGSAAPRLLQHMAKRELSAKPLLYWFLRGIGTVMVDRGRGQQALEEAVKYLQRGACMAIFPEGTRSTTGHMGKGHTGAIVLAMRSGCTILPAAIIGSDRAMPKGARGIRRASVTVRFGEPYRLPLAPDGTAIAREVLVRECVVLMERIEALLPPQMHASREDKRRWYGEMAARQDAPPGTA